MIETDHATIQALVIRAQVLEARLEIGEAVHAELAARLERVETLLFAFRSSIGGAAMCLEQAAKIGIDEEQRIASSVQVSRPQLPERPVAAPPLVRATGPIGLVPKNDRKPDANHPDLIA